MRYHLERTLPLTEITNALAFSPDGALLAVATRDRKASTLLYALEDWSLRPAPRFVRSDLAFVADGSLLVAGASVERYAVGGAKLGKRAFAVPGHPKGLTRARSTPDGRWVAVLKHLDGLELWYVGGAAPARVLARSSADARARFFFAADGGRFFFSTPRDLAQRPVASLHTVTLHPDGRCDEPTEGPFPEGLGLHDHVHATAHGLVALTYPDHDAVLFDWDTRRPRTIWSGSTGGRRAQRAFAVAPDGDHLVAESYRETADGRTWELTVVALPSGEERGTIAIGAVSAGLLALAPGAARVAYVRSDTDRAARVFRRDAPT